MGINSDAPRIAIAVSRRIDVDSVCVENPLYLPVRCGAVYDTNAQPALQGDNTGDNISEKRENYCELTVQYWLWKNVHADYYGLCHYRRYLSFAERHYRANDHGLVSRPLLTERECARFGLLDARHMTKEIEKYDLIVPEAAPVSRMPLPRGTADTVRELWSAHEDIFFEKGMVDKLLSAIERAVPQYLPAAMDYFAGDKHCGYNCFVMSRQVFERFCSFEIPIVDDLMDSLNTREFPRSPAYAGEMLFGVFVYHMKTREKWRICEKQIVFFEETRAVGRLQTIRCVCRSTLKRMVRAAANPIFPLGSRRRECGKRLYQKLLCRGHR